MAAGVAGVAARAGVAGPVVVAEPVAVAVLAVLGAVVEDPVVEDLVVEVALPGVPAERLELGPLGEQALPAERAAAVGQQPEAALLPGRAAPPRA